MYAYTAEEDTAESYQRSVRERANVSLQGLQDSLTNPSPNASLRASTHAKDQLEAAVHPRSLRWFQADARPKKYKDAVSQLQTLLQERPEVPYQAVPDYGGAPPPPPGPMPTPEEAVRLLQSQVTYMQQLEAENRYIKDEFGSIRAKVRDVLDENQRLHQELKRSVMEEIMSDGDIMKAGLADVSTENLDASMTRGNLKQWQIELEKLSALHTAKTNRLETQLAHSREEIQKYEQMVEELRSQLRLQDAIPTREDGLLPDAFMSDTQRSYHTQTVDRLTKERDELLEQVTVLKSRLQEMTHREEDAYQQMKRGIELVEQAQFEQTQAMVQREQLAEELNNMRQRFEAQVMNTQRQVQEEREMVKKENKVIADELNTKIKELLEKLAKAQTEQERMSRDKLALTSECDELKLQLRRYDKEVSMVTENFNAESTNAKIQKSQAVHEVQRLRKELDTLQRDKDQEKKCLSLELEELRRRLNKAERELVNSKEECIHLTTNSQALERELHLAKLARDSVERGRNDDLKVMAKRSQQREEELNNFVKDLEEQHSHTSSEMDVMLTRQNKLIGKLKSEVRRQTQQLEVLTKKNRVENGNLRRQNDELKQRLDRAITRLKVLEEQSDQHRRVHSKMTERLKMMDDHAQHQGTQVLELLARQTGLLKDRQLLAREIEFLRRQIARTNEEDIAKFCSSNKLLVDEVLDNLNVESSERRDSYITKPMDPINIDDLI